MTNTFRKPEMRKMYDTCRNLAAEGKMDVVHGTTDDNYRRGRTGGFKWKGPRDCLSYAAFCAGLDDRADAIRAGKE